MYKGVMYKGVDGSLVARRRVRLFAERVFSLGSRHWQHAGCLLAGRSRRRDAAPQGGREQHPLGSASRAGDPLTLEDGLGFYRQILHLRW